MFNINCIKRQVSVCDGLFVCLWMCGSGHPRTQLNPETSGRVQLLSNQPFVHQCVMVYWSVCECVVAETANATQCTNIWTCSSFKPARDICQYVVMVFFAFHCVDANTCKISLNYKSTQLLSILIFQVIDISMWWWRLYVSMCVFPYTRGRNKKKKHSDLFST